MKVVAFDTATRTGVAYGSAGDKPRAFSVDLSVQEERGKAPWPRRFSRLIRLTGKMIDDHWPDLIAVEAFVGGPKANAAPAGLVACVLGESDRLKVKTATYYPATVRQHFLGGVSKSSRTPIKVQVAQRCAMLGWDVGDTDAADAAALWDYACAVQSRSHQMTTVGGLFGVQK